MYILKINDENGQTRKWWYNFVYAWHRDNITTTYDVAEEFAKWGAELSTSQNGRDIYDEIVFQHEKDMTWFLVRWG